MASIENLTIYLAGESGVGKSAFLERHRYGTFCEVESMENPTVLSFKTNVGKLRLTIYENFLPPDIEVHGVIVMFSLLDFVSFSAIVEYVDELKRNRVPTIVCGNKIDKKDRAVDDARIRTFIGSSSDVNYFHISAKSNYNYEKPLLYIAKKCLGIEDLKFTGAVLM